jgi:hypothetical protein
VQQEVDFWGYCPSLGVDIGMLWHPRHWLIKAVTRIDVAAINRIFAIILTWQKHYA